MNEELTTMQSSSNCKQQQNENEDLVNQKFELKATQQLSKQPFLAPIEFSHLIEQMCDLKVGLPLVHVKTLRRTIRFCFSGRDLLSWLSESYLAKKFERSSVMPLADEMLARKIVEPATTSILTKCKRIHDDHGTLFRFAKSFRRRILIIGGGFAGVHLAKGLERKNYFNITMVTPKTYFEYIPSSVKLIDDPTYVSKIRIDYSRILKTTQIITASVERITNSTVQLDSGKRLLTQDFDHIVLATGSHYDLSMIKVKITSLQSPAQIINPMNTDEMLRHHDKICNANVITVIGAGAVGCEITGELAAKFPNKKIILISTSNQLLERMCSAAHDKIMHYFSHNFKNLNIILGERVQEITDREILTSKQRRFTTDVVLYCIGFKPNTRFLHGEAVNLRSLGMLKRKDSSVDSASNSNGSNTYVNDSNRSSRIQDLTSKLNNDTTVERKVTYNEQLMARLNSLAQEKVIEREENLAKSDGMDTPIVHNNGEQCDESETTQFIRTMVKSIIDHLFQCNSSAQSQQSGNSPVLENSGKLIVEDSATNAPLRSNSLDYDKNKLFKDILNLEQNSPTTCSNSDFDDEELDQFETEVETPRTHENKELFKLIAKSCHDINPAELQKFEDVLEITNQKSKNGHTSEPIHHNGEISPINARNKDCEQEQSESVLPQCTETNNVTRLKLEQVSEQSILEDNSPQPSSEEEDRKVLKKPAFKIVLPQPEWLTSLRREWEKEVKTMPPKKQNFFSRNSYERKQASTPVVTPRVTPRALMFASPISSPINSPPVSPFSSPRDASAFNTSPNSPVGKQDPLPPEESIGIHYIQFIDSVIQATFEHADQEKGNRARLSATLFKILEEDDKDDPEAPLNDNISEQELQVTNIANAMHDAVQQGKLLLLQKLYKMESEREEIPMLNLGVNYLLSCSNKCTLLHTAARYNQVQILRYLLDECNTNIDCFDASEATPLFYAIIRGNMKSVVLLLSRGAQINARDLNESTPLMVAMRNKRYEIAKLLVLSGADVHLKGRKGNTVMHMVCEEGSVGKAQYLLEKTNARFFVQNRDNETPLMLALHHSPVVKYLLDWVNEFYPSKAMTWLCAKDSHENNMVHRCVIGNHVQSLLQIICKIPGRCLLIMANDRNMQGNTPLHIAVSNKNMVMTLLLCMTESVDFTAKNKKNQTPLDIATGEFTALLNLVPQRKQIAELIKKQGDFEPAAVEEEVERRACEISRTISTSKLNPPSKPILSTANIDPPVTRRRKKTIYETLFPKKDTAQVALIKFEESERVVSWAEKLRAVYKKDEEKTMLLKIIHKVYSTATMLDENGFVKVDKYLQVRGYPKLFAIGDVTNIPECKLAQNAEYHAETLIENFDRMERRKELAEYEGFLRKALISLGPKSALLTYNDSFCRESVLLHKLKNLVEYYTLYHLKK